MDTTFSGNFKGKYNSSHTGPDKKKKKKSKCVSLITLVKQKEHTLVVPLTFVTAATKSLKQLRFNKKIEELWTHLYIYIHVWIPVTAYAHIHTYR